MIPILLFIKAAELKIIIFRTESLYKKSGFKYLKKSILHLKIDLKATSFKTMQNILSKKLAYGYLRINLVWKHRTFEYFKK